LFSEFDIPIGDCPDDLDGLACRQVDLGVAPVFATCACGGG